MLSVLNTGKLGIFCNTELMEINKWKWLQKVHQVKCLRSPRVKSCRETINNCLPYIRGISVNGHISIHLGFF